MTAPIYLDHHSTTPLDPRVLDAMLPYLGPKFGNPASRTHAFGWEAARAVESARAAVAALIGADPDEIVFTSGATESVNLALRGVFETRDGGGLVVAQSEHRAVLDVAAVLEGRGVCVTRLPVDSRARIAVRDLEAALERKPRLVSLMAANNEVGTLHPLEQIAPAVHASGAWLHSDASQAAGKIRWNVRSAGTDLLSLTAHKLHGPKGAGALFVRRGIERGLVAQMAGGGHERGLRSGTLNVPAIVGFGAAAEIALAAQDAEQIRLRGLRDRLLRSLTDALPAIEVNGDLEARLPNSLSVAFSGIDGEALLTALPDVAASTGSACESASKQPSHVLQAMGLSPQRIRATVRFGLGRFNTEEEIDRAATRIVEEVARLRACAGLTAGRSAAAVRP